MPHAFATGKGIFVVDAKSTGNPCQEWTNIFQQAEELCTTKETNSEETTYRMGESICKLSILRRI